MFRPHQNLSDEINRNIIRSEIEGGVYLRDLPEAAKLEVQTRNRYYIIVPAPRWIGLDLGPSGILSGTRSGANRWIELGRFDAQDRLSRPRHAHGIPPPRL